MITHFICVALLICCVARAEGVPGLERVHSSEDLARFISSMATNDAVFSVLLGGLEKTNSITVTPYASAIPIREICAFRDDKGEVWRFHIGIFDERQYRLMKDLLKRKMHHDT
jgi:hypothetical protein